MASLKNFLVCPLLFLCFSCSFANRVLLNSHAGDKDLHVDGKQAPTVDTGSGSGVGGGHEGVGGGSNGHGVKSGIDPIVNGIEVGVGVGYGQGFGSGYWGGPGINGPNSECILGYACPTNRRGGCNNIPYGNCQSYGFYPLAPMDHLHEVEINWAKSKPVETAQHLKSEPYQSPPIIVVDNQPIKAQHVVSEPYQSPPIIVVDNEPIKAQHVVSEPYQSPPIIVVDNQPIKAQLVVSEPYQSPPIINVDNHRQHAH